MDKAAFGTFAANFCFQTFATDGAPFIKGNYELKTVVRRISYE